MKDAATLEAFFSLAFLLFSLFVTCAFPFIYKREVGRPMKGERHEHTTKRAQQDLTPFDLFTRDLRPSLSPVCNLYYKLVLVT